MPIVNEKQLDDCKYEIAFSYDEKKVSEIIDEVARDIGKHYRIPGNRPGKASVSAVKLGARKQVLDAASNKLLNEAYKDILFEKSWKAFTQPQVNNIEITYNTFSAKIVIGCMPEITLAQYRDLELVEPANVPNMAALYDKFVENICSNFSNSKPFDENDFLLNGDSAVINFEGTIDGRAFDKNKGEGVLIEMGKGQTLDGFEDNLIGMKPGEKREFEIKFDHKVPVSNLIGRTVKFDVELLSAAKKTPAAFDEELVKKLKFETMDQLKADIQKQVEEYRKEMIFNVLKTTVSEKLLELNNIEVPPWMVSSTAVQVVEMQKKTFDTLPVDEKGAIIEETTKNIKLSFIIEKIKSLEIETELSQQELMKILEANISKFPESTRKELVEGKNMALYGKILNEIQTEYVLRWIINHSIVMANKGE